MAQSGSASRKVTCEECFFGRNLLCAVSGEVCPTFRPARPEGLRPPRQMRFEFRGRRQAAWAFPAAHEQAALHA